jgi:hypothetical protein
MTLPSLLYILFGILVMCGTYTPTNKISKEMLAKPTTDPAALTYCQGCGCRHRTQWMTWDDNGTYRCRVCCLDYVEMEDI